MCIGQLAIRRGSGSMAKKQRKQAHKCSLPWCDRHAENLNTLNVLWKGKKLMVCNFHAECYTGLAKEVLENKIRAGFNPAMSIGRTRM